MIRGLIRCVALVGAAMIQVSAAGAGVPDVNECSAVTAAGDQEVWVMVVPNGSGFRLDSAMANPGITDVDATITVTVRDVNGDPIYMFPASDIWLQSASKDLAFCSEGNYADHDTDMNGETTFTGALYAGYHGTGVAIIVSGQPINQPPLNINFNSPDVNGDLSVNLTDVVIFAGYYYGKPGYDEVVDLYPDGVLNLSDIVLMAGGMGGTCP